MQNVLLQTRSLGAACPRVAGSPQPRRLRPVCALSLDRSGADGSGRKPRSVEVAASSALSLQQVQLQVAESLVTEEAQSAYDAGYQAGLAAARKAQESKAAPEAPAPGVQPVQDSMFRSLVKAFSWRFFSTATTIFLTLTFFNASLEDALEMGAAEFVSKYVLFLIHERLWILVTLF